MSKVLHLRGCRLLCAAPCRVLYSTVACARTSRIPGQPGTLAGILVDGETGEMLIGANFRIEGTLKGAAADLNGWYEFQAEPGTYRLECTYMGYNPLTIENVLVVSGEITKIEVALYPESIEVGEVVVTAELLLHSEAGLLRARARSVAVSDAISADAISRSGSGDDGVKFFGGTVDMKYSVSAFNAVDWDQSWRDSGQFWFVLQCTAKAEAAAELYGAGGDKHFQPYAIPTVHDATYVGPGVGNQPESDQGQMPIFRDNSGGFYRNSVFTDFQTSEGGYAIKIEDLDNSGANTEDSRKRFESGYLGLSHNIFWAFGCGQDPTAWINTDGDMSFLAQIVDHMATKSNEAGNPEIRGIERGTMGTGQLDPRPAGNSIAFTLATAGYPDIFFFTPVDFIGAFGRTNWSRGWTALHNLGYNGDIALALEEVRTELPTGVRLDQSFPNPFNPETTIEFGIERAQHVRLAVYDVLGRQVRLIHEGYTNAGTLQVSFNVPDLASGLYLYRLESEDGSITRKMTLVK